MGLIADDFLWLGVWKAHKLVWCNCTSGLDQAAASISFSVIPCHSVLLQCIEKNISKQNAFDLNERMMREAWRFCTWCPLPNQVTVRVALVITAKSPGLLSQPFLHLGEQPLSFVHLGLTSLCYQLLVPSPGIKLPVHQSSIHVLPIPLHLSFPLNLHSSLQVLI